MKKKLLILLIIGLLCIPVLLPLFRNGFFQTDDADWLIIRFSAFYQALRDGQFPVRWLGRLNNGYGYPVANFAYPGFMYVTAPLHVFFGLLVSVKIFIVSTFIVSGIFTYLWLRTYVKTYAAMIGAFMYVYAPYHIYDLYTRGSLGELYALAIIPFILWNIQRKSIVLTALGIGLLITAHNTLAVLFIPFIITYALIQTTKRFTILSTVLGVGSSAFFWIPALLELSETRFSNTSISDWSEYFATISQMGWSSLIIVGVSCVYALYVLKSKKTASYQAVVWLFVIMGVGSLWLSSELSSFLWPYLPSSLVQFPFRLVSLLILSVSFLSAWLLNLLTRSLMLTAGIILIGLTIMENFSQLNTIEYVAHDQGYYATNMSTTTVKDEYMPRWVSNIPQHMAAEKIIAPGSIVDNVMIYNDRVSFHIQSPHSMLVTVNTVYFPGWYATVDNKEVPITIGKNTGLIQIPVSQGSHELEVVFGRTGARIIGELISIISIIGIGLFVLLRFRKKNGV